MQTTHPIVFWNHLITAEQSRPCCGGLRQLLPSGAHVQVIAKGVQHSNRVLLEANQPTGKVYAWADNDEVSS